MSEVTIILLLPGYRIGAGVVTQYCNSAPGGLRSIYGVQSRVKSREILHDYTGACDDTAIIRGFNSSQGAGNSITQCQASADDGSWIR